MTKKLLLPTLSSLRPFRSFLLIQLQGNALADDHVLFLRSAIIGVASTLKGVTQTLLSPRSRKSDLFSAFAFYIRERPARWSSDPAILDRENHLIVVSGNRGWCAVFLSDGGLREAVSTEMAEAADAFKDYRVVPTTKLNAVFVKGDARTLWLSNVHGRSTIRPDNKVLSGPVLQDALDPMADQAYAFTAARCYNDVTGSRATYGIAPRKSRLWFKRSRNWDDYTQTVSKLLRAMDESTGDEESPLPVLSAPILRLIDPAALGEAYEISLLPWDTESPADTADRDVDNGPEVPEYNFEVVRGTPPRIVAEITDLAMRPLGQYEFELQIDSSGRVSWSIGALNVATDAALPALRRFSDRLSVSFERGYRTSGPSIFAAHYRDVVFNGLSWDTFRGFSITKEKPNPLSHMHIGAQDSLFCWVKKQWIADALPWLPKTGWLASNDGALEIADFVHLQLVPVPRLTLVHIKGAKSSAPQRTLAVAPYEIVVSQAIKNLRHIDPILTAAAFSARLGHQIKKAVWREGQLERRDAMLAAIEDQGSRLARRVVVVQPQTRRQAYSKALTAPDGSKERHLVRQLNMLLLSAQHSCAALGADFSVIAHDA
jgi:hypothetical protein